jgi:regulator of replication initiation timing
MSKIFKIILSILNKLEMEVLDESTLNNLADELLKHFKDGIYAFDQEASSQSKSYYNHKSRIKKYLSEAFQIISEIQSGKGYLQCFIDTIKDYDPENNQSIKDINRQLKSKIKHLEQRLKLREEGQDNSMCGLCYYKMKDAQKAFEEQYAIDNNLVSFQDEIKSLREKCYKNNMDCMKYESVINELKEELQDMKYEMNHLRMENENLKQQLSQMDNNDDTGKKKKKKKKKKQPEINTKQLKKLLKFMEAQEQSSSEEEYHSDSESSDEED